MPDEPAFVGEIAENDYFDIDKDRTRIMLGFSWKVCLYYTLQYMLNPFPALDLSTHNLPVCALEFSMVTVAHTKWTELIECGNP